VRTVVYIDGFNLYYRHLKPSLQFKWLNLKALCDSILAPPMVVQRVVLLSSAMATTSMRKQSSKLPRTTGANVNCK